MDIINNSNADISSDDNKKAAIYSLWFGLDYGSILTAFALYNTIENYGKKPYLVQKPPELWSDHYADKENIAGKFIYNNCDVLEVFSSEDDKNVMNGINTHIVGSDIVWDCNVVGRQTGTYFYLSDVKNDEAVKIAYGSSIGSRYNIDVDKISEYYGLLSKFKRISVKNTDDAFTLSDFYHIQPEIVIDPVFLCSKDKYIACAERAVAKEAEKEKNFIFTYIKNGDSRKKHLVQRGSRILFEKQCFSLRNFIDINRFPESKAAIGLEPAFHICVEDWLYYLINSEFVITDDYYGMCFAIIFQKPFVVIASRDMDDIMRYTTILAQLNLTERIIYLDEDFKTKDYLFRKPVRYDRVDKILSALKEDAYKWLEDALASDKGNNVKSEDMSK